MTTAQLQASDPEYSVWVSASAGTGKTTVLASRVLRILLSGTSPGKILCLTYTNAGAAEMECRIKAKLCEWVTLSEEKLTEAISNLTGTAPDDNILKRARKLFLETLDTPEGIKIQTIHSFCQGLMRRFPLEAGIVPHFKIMDNKTSRELLKEAQTRMLLDHTKYTPEIASAIKNIFWRIHEGTFSDVVKDIINDRGKLEKSIEQSGGISGLKKAIFNLLEIDGEIDEDEILRNSLQDSSLNNHELISAAQELLKTSSTFIKIGQAILAWFEKDISARIEGFNDYKLAFLTEKDEPRKSLLPTKSNIPPQALLDEQERIYKLVNDIKKTRIGVLSASILDIASTMLGNYSDLKSGKAYLDYNDLIMKSDNLLSGKGFVPWVLYKIDGGIDHLLIDEAQDTSQHQWNIIDSLCSEFFSGTGARDTTRTIFVVGDEKQSIFSFQGAAPNIFSKMQEKFQRRVEEAGQKWRSVRMDKSFRSSPVVLQLVDEIFKGSGEQAGKTSTATTGITSTPSEHIPFHKEMYGKIELWPLIESQKIEAEPGWVMPLEYLEKQDVHKILAEKIADEIAMWLKNGRILKAEGRKVRAGDIMILLRTRTNLADNIISSLKIRKVPVAGHDRLIITRHLAVMDLIALGNFLLLPEDSLSLACVLKSPLIGFLEDDLFDIAYGRDKKSLWKSLKDKAVNNNKYQDAFNYLNNLLNKVDFCTPFALYCYVLEALGGRKNLISRLGEEINDPVDEFLSLALNHEKSHPPSLQGFLSWLASGESEIKRDMEQGNSDTVRVITVHGSKGLEAPIVIMPDTISMPDGKNSRILWYETQDSADIMLWPGNSYNAEKICQSIKQRRAKEDAEEYNRLLYVAITRAKSELYIAGTAGKNSKKSGCWYDSISEAMARLTTEDADGAFRLVGGNSKTPGKDNPEDAHVKTLFPEYLLSPPRPEPTPSSPISPSKIEDGVSSGKNSLLGRKRIIEGKIIHSLLEFMPDIAHPERREAGKNFLKRKFISMPEIDIDNIIGHLISIMDMSGLKDVFGEHSRAEVPIIGIVENKVISGRIDRLCVLEDKVIIVDYKTGQSPPDIASISGDYIRQMSLYSSIMQRIYQDKSIEAYLIWTEGAIVFDISNKILEYKYKYTSSV